MGDFIRGKVADSGRVVIPAEMRREFHIEDGQEVVFCRGENGIELLTAEQLVQKSQEAVRRYIKGNDLDLTEELLQARKRDKSLA
jgi:AbrB family looped-hinge helix DNA binding protein